MCPSYGLPLSGSLVCVTPTNTKGAAAAAPFPYLLLY